MRIRPALFCLAAVLCACRRTHVEIATEVGPFGNATRTVLIQSQDDAQAADLPGNLRLARGPFATLEEDRGLYRAIASFSDASQAASPFEFLAEGMDRTASSSTAFASSDWVLFRHYAYSETVHDVVQEQDVQVALDEVAENLSQLTEDTFRALLGDGYDETLLHARFGEDLRRMARELAFLCWRELQTLDSDAGDTDAALRRSLQRVCGLLHRYGLDLQPDWLAGWLQPEGDAGFTAPPELRRALAGWVELGLRPRDSKSAARQVVVRDLQGLLFDGPFQQEFRRRMEQRFGGADAADAWVQRSMARIFGLFGQMTIFSSDELDFTLRVRMPGTLLRSNGYLADSSAFVEFPAKAVYPDGAGLSCESVSWDYGALGALRARRTPGNEAAVSWMNLAGRGEGPQRQPDGKLMDLLRACIQAQSLDALEQRAQQGGESGPQAQRVLAWLRGEG